MNGNTADTLQIHCKTNNQKMFNGFVRHIIALVWNTDLLIYFITNILVVVNS